MAIPDNRTGRQECAPVGRLLAVAAFVVAIAGIAIFVVFGKASVTREGSVKVDIVLPTEHVPPKTTSDE